MRNFPKQGLIPQTVKLQPLLAQAETLFCIGSFDEAAALYNDVLKVSPNHPLAAYNLALILARLNKPQPAIRKLQGLLKSHPDHGAAHYQLGKLFQSQGDVTRASYHLRQCVKIDPHCEEAYLALIELFAESRRHDEVAMIATQAEKNLPMSPQIATQLGIAAIAADQPLVGKSHLLRALELDPSQQIARYNLARLDDDLRLTEHAIDGYRALLRIAPDFRQASFNLAELDLRTGNVQAAMEAFSTLLKDTPEDAALLSSLMMASQYQIGETAETQAARHVLFSKLQQARNSWPNSREPTRRLRIGLVSPDLHSHPVGYFLVGVLEDTDPAELEFHVFADYKSNDDIATRIAKTVKSWTDTAGWSDQKLSDTIGKAGIDILIDLSGHTRGNRMGVFTLRPAPLQISWAGYVGTTGLPAMTGLIADRYHVPIEDDGAYVEHIIRMPDGYVCYTPPHYAPDVGPLPAGSHAPLTFASFHGPAKLNEPLVGIWSEVLRALPGSRISFIYPGYELLSVQARVRTLFADNGIGSDQLSFEGALPHPELLGRYNTVDVALDTFPYSGGLTTCEALWMGVPVITLPGKSFAGRHSLSHLSNVGLTETIASTSDEYVGIARRLNEDRSHLSKLRQTLRPQMVRSPLTDSHRFARNLAKALRKSWREWCSDQQAKA